ncbi:PTS sugar transporter subunit IIA [Lactobacillus sp. ESL0791]|uniref:PTS sugar transporter subunit IIA n=1 Tax=Lactobacillus sp. ESL0791 TaxID=2983234 RepID=UPI0023F678B3|nr:PTS sugar transporter subunit IIA [Lactobacillus sp. ESL0791]MDF7639466.1 PTS sugar transporter subunit IIA [Lactobacillus sp. ESL0791]
MIGILVVTHGKLAQGFKHASEMIAGKADQFGVLGLSEGENIEDFKNKVSKKISDLNSGKGVIVLCDLFGASPYNVTLQSYPKLKSSVEYEIVSGVNLPMIIETILERRNYDNLAHLVAHIAEVGKSAIRIQNFNF